MPGELIVLRGLPGSGKTSLALMEQTLSGGVLAGRDHLRRLLFGAEGGQLGRAEENRVTELQAYLIRQGLRAGDRVLVDDMNLRPRYVRRLVDLALAEGAKWRVIDLTDEPLEICIQRDHDRERTVGAERIRDLYARFIRGGTYPLPLPATEVAEAPDRYEPSPDLPKAVLVDIDGTIALMGDRSPFDMARVGEDAPNRPVIEIVWSLYQQGYAVVFVSGRSEDARAETERWLQRHVGLPGYRLFMRSVGDGRRDSIVKRELFDRHIRERFNVLAVLDDRNQVVAMWRELGLVCLQVAEGAF
ncbi:AAA family ATPase [Amycolatopsis minnesotensis]|uniref:Polynucleotide kinase PNKP phosphatase domain-containing protein n=1 Tax=Amycolatopsis minnesotensis TaxID=337894 RepID=A0ABP5BDK5_9PSEU